MTEGDKFKEVSQFSNLGDVLDCEKGASAWKNTRTCELLEKPPHSAKMLRKDIRSMPEIYTTIQKGNGTGRIIIWRVWRLLT